MLLATYSYIAASNNYATMIKNIDVEEHEIGPLRMVCHLRSYDQHAWSFLARLASAALLIAMNSPIVLLAEL